jgi:Inner membrane component of T3SS, cytoplasmic domain
MRELTLSWIEAGQPKTAIVRDGNGKHSGTFWLGRHPDECDILLNDPSVSRLHVEIFFDPIRNGFYLRKLPQGRLDPVVDGRSIQVGEAELKLGSQISLGATAIAVTAISVPVAPIAETVIVSPGQNPLPLHASPAASSRNSPQDWQYKLICPNSNCPNPDPQKAIGYEHLNLGCPWCGYSLAAAQSVLLPPGKGK